MSQEGVFELPGAAKPAPTVSASPLNGAQAAPPTATDPQLESHADQLLASILSIKPKDLSAREHKSQAVRHLGSRVQQELARQSTLLRQPMQKLVQDAEDGGSVATDLLTLQEQVARINPNQVNFSMGGFRRLLARIPRIGSPVARWFAQYQTVEAVIKDIVASLKAGKGQLQRDNLTLREDQQRMRGLIDELQQFIALGQLLDDKLNLSLARVTDPEQKHFIEEEILFPLRQRLLDLQQLLAVNQQGVLTIEVVVRNNEELIRGVDRAVNVTVTALGTAATLALALQTQKNVLRGVQAVHQTTNDLIASTAERLKTQGVEIQKQAASAQLDIDTLKRAFADVDSALAQLSSFRREALPRLGQSIQEMSQLSSQMEQSILKMEGSNQARYTLEDAIEFIQPEK